MEPLPLVATTHEGDDGPEDAEEDPEGWGEGPAVVLAPQTPRVSPQLVDDDGEEEEEEEDDEDDVEESAAFPDATASGKGLVIIVQSPNDEREREPELLVTNAPKIVVAGPVDDEEPEKPWDGEDEDEYEEEEEQLVEEEEGEEPEEPEEPEDEDDGDAEGQDKVETADNWSDSEEQALQAHSIAPEVAELGLQGEEMALLAEHLRRVEEGIRFAMRSLASSDALGIDPDVEHATIEVVPQGGEIAAVAVAEVHVVPHDEAEAGEEDEDELPAAPVRIIRDFNHRLGLQYSTHMSSPQSQHQSVPVSVPIQLDNDEDFFADVEPDPPSPRLSPSASFSPGPRRRASVHFSTSMDSPPLPPSPLVNSPSATVPSTSVSTLQLTESPAPLHS